jgi:hypothetical protein
MSPGCCRGLFCHHQQGQQQQQQQQQHYLQLLHCLPAQPVLLVLCLLWLCQRHALLLASLIPMLLQTGGRLRLVCRPDDQPLHATCEQQLLQHLQRRLLQGQLQQHASPLHHHLLLLLLRVLLCLACCCQQQQQQW